MSNNDLSRILGVEAPIKVFPRGSEFLCFWNPGDSPTAIYLELQDIQTEIAALDSEILLEATQKQEELAAKQEEMEAKLLAAEEDESEESEGDSKPKSRSKTKTKTKKVDQTKIAEWQAQITDEVEKFKNERREKQRARRTPLYIRYLELIAREDKGGFESKLRPSEVYWLYKELKPIIDRVLDDPSDYEPEDKELVGKALNPVQPGSNGASKTTEMMLQPTSVG